MEEFSRFIQLIGNDKFNILKDKKVVIIGIGGVGGYAFEALVRGGISNITIVDYDIIDITNLNRQVITNINNIGRYKVDVAKERALHKPAGELRSNNWTMLQDDQCEMLVKCEAEYIFNNIKKYINRK